MYVYQVGRASASVPVRTSVRASYSIGNARRLTARHDTKISSSSRRTLLRCWATIVLQLNCLNVVSSYDGFN